MKNNRPLILALVLVAPIGQAQGFFQNLGFEAAHLTPIPLGQFGDRVPIDQALPGWSGFLGTQQVTSVLQNNFALGGANISILGPNWTAIGIIQGQYSVLLQAGGLLNPSFVDASISQTGLIPVGAESIQLKVFGSDFSVSFAGQTIPLIPLSSGGNYTLYGGDVAPYAGRTGELTLSALTAPTHRFNNVYFDSIVFSAQVVPEPNVLGLLAIGLSLLGWRSFSNRRVKDRSCPQPPQRKHAFVRFALGEASRFAGPRSFPL